jgi:hypothetical protein
LERDMSAEPVSLNAAHGRIFGHHESEAMFEAVYNALAVLGKAGESSSNYVGEFQGERELLLSHRLALARLYDACQSENFNRTGNRDMSANLRAALRLAKEALDG